MNVQFPPGAAGEPLDIRLTKHRPTDYVPPSPDMPLVATWNFDALATTRADAPVHVFPGRIVITFHFSADDLLGRDPATLVFWTFDETAGRWMAVPGTVDAGRRTVTVQVKHFSLNGATAQAVVDTAPLLNGNNVDLQTGSASLNLPIKVPSAPNGLAPDLSLSYQSMRVEEMRQYSSLSSWVGMGWELSPGSISINYDPSYTRYFLDAAGFGGEMLQDGRDGANYIWRLRNNPYIRIRTACNDGSCPWYVTDQQGRQYVFGNDDQHRRWYGDYDIYAHTWTRRYYRLDIASVTDTLNNQITYSYWQQHYNDCTATPCYDYVMAAYIQDIFYDYNQVQIHFNLGFDNDNAALGRTPAVPVRNDDPYDVYDAGCSGWYRAPKVMETRKLSSVEVNVLSGGSWRHLRRYDLGYTTNPFSYFGSQQYPGYCPPQPFSGTNTLTSFTEKDTTETTNLYSMTFTYTSGTDERHDAYRNGTTGADVFGYDWPHLKQATNGFGGAVNFVYSLQGNDNDYCLCLHWTHSAVTRETRTAWNGTPGVEPDVVIMYAYSGLAEQDQPEPDGPVDTFNAENRGYYQVTETDAGGNQTVHNYFTTGSDWSYEVLTGHEKKTVVKDANGTTLQDVQTTWGARGVANRVWPSMNYTVNFIYKSDETTTLLDGSHQKATYAYDDGADCTQVACFGLQTKSDQFVNPGDASEVITNTAYNKNTSAWIFVPQREEKLDPSGGLLSCVRYYYDGSNVSASTPTRGLLTAQSAASDPAMTQTSCEGSTAVVNGTNSYMVYNLSGNQIIKSVATTIAPESNPAGNGYGWLPTNVPASATTYDSIYNVYPITVIDAIGGTAHTTSYSYTDSAHGDYVLGKPTQIVQPSGNVVTLTYDDFGRITQAYDSLDSSTYPTETFTYTWGAAPNKTVELQRTISGTANTRTVVSCVDGFGREVDHREHYQGIYLNSVRTDYDARGMKAVETNPVSVGLTASCETTPSSTAARDRKVFAYDPLGNAVGTASLAANQTNINFAPTSRTAYSGLTTISLDEKYNATKQVRNVSAGTLTISEPASGVSSTILRPNGTVLQQWNGYGGVNGAANYTRVNEAAPDDDGSYIAVQAPPCCNYSPIPEDEHTYPGANLPQGSTVNAVILHFRFKHYNASIPNPSTPDMIPSYQVYGAPKVFGPAYSRTNSDGWSNDQWVMPVNPRTNQPWSLADVNTQMWFGFQVYYSPDASPYVTQAYVEVVYQTSPPASTTYQYDRPGRLTDVVDPLSNHTQLSYDLLGRKTDMTDPDMGHWSYTYFPSGKLATQTDARNVTTNLYYDAIDRLTTKTYSDSTPSVGFLWDSYDTWSPGAPACSGGAATAAGQMTRMADGAGFEFDCYDVRGRELTTRRTVDSVNYDISRAFGAMDQVTQLTYPDGEQVNYGLTSSGQLSSMSIAGGTTLASSIIHEAWSAPASITAGSGEVSAYTYDYRMRPTDLQTSKGGVYDQNLHLTYDDASNVTGVNDLLNADSATYTYDQLNRLTGMSVNGVPSAAYGYNSIGNIMSKTEGSSSFTLNYPASGQTSVRPHAVSSTSSGLNMTYDADGNLTNQNSYWYHFDAANRLTSRKFGSGNYSYTYGGDGTLVKRALNFGTPTWTVYIGGIYEKNSDGSTVKYYVVDGQRVAMSKAGTIYYLLTDHLGSSTVVTDQNGAVVATQKYWPYGGMRSSTGSMPTDKQFTGQQQEVGDVALGLYNFKARFYSTTLGRFVSADPVVPDSGPAAWNRYSYAYGNPLRYSDPTGNDPDCRAGSPCPVSLPSPPTPPVYTGTPIPGISQSQMDQCVSNPAACLFWAVGGDWKQYIYAVAKKFGVDPEILAAIVLNEMDHRSSSDSLHELLGKLALSTGPAGWAATELLRSLGVDADEISYGIAQIQLGAARRLEDSGYVTSNVSDLETVERLQDPMWALYYAGAYLASARDTSVAKEGRLNVDYSNDLIVLYFSTADTYHTWVTTYHADPEQGIDVPGQIHQVRDYLPGAVDQLAGRLSQ